MCRERGLRLTPLRTDVLQLVADSDRPIKAYHVLERIRASKAISAPPTAYRTLDFLVGHGFVHKLESINAFVACHLPGEQHTATFLICDGCNAAVEIEGNRVGLLLKGKAHAVGFLPHADIQTLEVHGLCLECRNSCDARC